MAGAADENAMVGGAIGRLCASSAYRMGRRAADPTAAMYDPTRVIAVDIAIDPDRWDRLRARERTFVSLFSASASISRSTILSPTFRPTSRSMVSCVRMSGFARRAFSARSIP